MKFHFAREQVFPREVKNIMDGSRKGWTYLMLIRHDSFQRLKLRLLEGHKK